MAELDGVSDLNGLGHDEEGFVDLGSLVEVDMEVKTDGCFDLSFHNMENAIGSHVAKCCDHSSVHNSLSICVVRRKRFGLEQNGAQDRRHLLLLMNFFQHHLVVLILESGAMLSRVDLNNFEVSEVHLHVFVIKVVLSEVFH